MPLSLGAKPPTLVGNIDARLDLKGDMYALFVLNGNRWFEWRQGRLPREMPLQLEPNRLGKFAVSPDLKTVLIAHDLSAAGIICEYNGRVPRRPECESRTPQHGAIADLWNIETGRKLWSITGTAFNFSRSYKPAISPDGRFALVTMPVGKNSNEETIALVSMVDGHEIQRFNKPEAFDFALRFGRDGRSFSIDGDLAILNYQLVEWGAAQPRPN
jgi:hypothetical protein